MNKEEWRRKITEASENAGTYREYFDDVIDTLAEILDLRDNAREKFYASGGEPIVEHTNKAGATNIAKNPMLIVIDDLNKTALTYWRDLGLTPAGLKRINDTAMKIEKPKKTALEIALEQLSKD